MKRIIKNYIVRDPSTLIKNLGRNYNTHTFSPLEDNQTYFEDLVQFSFTIYILFRDTFIFN